MSKRSKNPDMIDDAKTGFSEITKLMRMCFRYPVISNEEAVYLLDLLDTIIYETLVVLDRCSSCVRMRYAEIVRNYAFHPVDKRSSHASRGPDTILLGSVFWLSDPEAKSSVHYMDVIRNQVHLFRLFWLDFLCDVGNKTHRYRMLAGTDYGREEAKQEEAELTKLFGVRGDCLYGMSCAVALAVQRNTRIIDKLTYPYLRKVVTHAKHYGITNHQMFKENFQNGSTGIRIAIGRHDSELGAFASSVDRWIRNRIMTFIRANGMLIPIPDKAFTIKNIVDRALSKNPSLTLEDIAEAENLKYSHVVEAINMVEAQSGSYIDLADEDEATSKHNNSYIDRSTDSESVENQVHEQINDYATVLNIHDRALLTVVYGVAGIYTPPKIHKSVVIRERARQLLAASCLANKNI